MENGEGEGMRVLPAASFRSSRLGSSGLREAQGSVGKAAPGREGGDGQGKWKSDREREEGEKVSRREKVRLRLYSNDKRTQLLQSELLWSCNRGGNVGDVETLKMSNEAYCKPF